MTEAHVLHSTFFLLNLFSARVCVPICECVRAFSFLSIVSFLFRPPQPFASFVSTFHFIFLFCRISSLPQTPSHSRFTANDCYNECAAQLFRLSTHYLSSLFHSFFFLCALDESVWVWVYVCVRCLCFPFCFLDCTVFVLFRFVFFSLFSFLVCAFEQCEYCII